MDALVKIFDIKIVFNENNEFIVFFPKSYKTFSSLEDVKFFICDLVTKHFE